VQVPTDLAEALGHPELAKKVFYVWFDAPIGYIAATKEWADAQHQPDAAWQRWWRTDLGAADVTYTQFMGKDNVYFHTLSFPATLIGSAEPWLKVNTLKSYNWLTYYGGKFSTSLGVGIFTDVALELLPADYWRYYLLSRAPEQDDSEFRWPDMQAVINKDLADVLGNFINRTITLAQKQSTPLTASAWGPAEDALVITLTQGLATLTQALSKTEMRQSVQALRALWVVGNEYLAREEPWKLLKTDPARGLTVLHTALNLIGFYGRIMAPIVPHSPETARFSGPKRAASTP
jgi:methionyl-tRNA synthetase